MPASWGVLTMIGVCQGIEEPDKRIPSGQSWSNLSKKNKVLLDYNSKYKINNLLIYNYKE